MLDGAARALVLEAFGGRLRPPVHLRLRTTGIPESKLAERVEALLPADRGPVRLAYLPSLRGVELRFTVGGEVDPAEARAWLDRMQAALGELEGFFYQGEDLVEAIADALLASGRTLAVAESCTGGLIAKRLTDRSGSSRWFRGGVVAYADSAKIEQLGVPSDVLARAGAVSAEVARAMAEGAARAFGADAGIGITGIAGPTGGTPDKPVGTVWYAVSVGAETVADKRVFVGDREAVRERSAQAALNLLYRTMTAG
jgi:nicotinamide-nucleotide amidase